MPSAKFWAPITQQEINFPGKVLEEFGEAGVYKG